jgi:hypothetical protein
LEGAGYVVDVVECSNARISRDLWGFLDVLAVGHGLTLGVQVTTAAHVAERLTKVRSFARTLDVLDVAGWRVEVHGWKPAGGLRQVVVLNGRTNQTRGDS